MNITTTLCSDWMTGSYLIVQTNTFLLTNVTAMTLGEGHKKVIQYISPDPYFLCPKYLRFGSNDFDVRSKRHCGSDSGCRCGHGSENELKT